jgi:hypothetical protein
MFVTYADESFARLLGWDVLLRAFLMEFSPLDDVALYIHTYLYVLLSDWFIPRDRN